MCGGNSFTSFCAALGLGSSPRVRGKRHQHTPTPHGHRLIPACAGKTLFDVSTGKQRRAHPRVCGENHPVNWHSLLRQGSSPRVRGKPRAIRTNSSSLGLIPACAGKTRASNHSRTRRRAHPRVCGENSAPPCSTRWQRGSSPRVRGKQTLGLVEVSTGGLIPACAGKTVARLVGLTAWGAHPRVCGENDVLGEVVGDLSGSSPRVRGKRIASRSARNCSGLIPACAGKTPSWFLFSVIMWAHPRVCGENLEPPPLSRGKRGSSPRVRGKPRSGSSSASGSRLIPACAGKTARAAGSSF